MGESPFLEPIEAGATKALPLEVVVVEPENMNLLGLILASLLRRRLADRRAARHVRSLRGEVALDAGGMRVTLRFEHNRVAVIRGSSARARAEIRGTLEAFFDAALRRNRVRRILRRQLAARGNPLVLRHVLALLVA